MSNPKKIVNKMFDQDAFSQWLDIEIIEVKDGYCKLKVNTITECPNF